MATFNGGIGAFTPSTDSDNWTLFADGAGDLGAVVSIGWGGRLTTSTGYRTRWCRPSVNGTTVSASLSLEANNPGSANLCTLVKLVTAPTLPADPRNLHAQDWNAHGGLGFVVLPLASPWFVVNSSTAGQGQISCRNVAGTDANGSNYTVSWQE